MMTLEQIQAANLNPRIVEEAHNQAEKRLLDVLETKKNHEQKAFILLNAYLTLALAILGVAGSIYKSVPSDNQWIPFFIAGILLITGSVLFSISLTDKNYGSVGSNPDMWLNQGIIDSTNEQHLYVMLAYITFHYQNRIEVSIKSNDAKTKLIRFGMYAGIFAPVALIISYFCI